MTALTDDQREVIELRFFAGLSVLEAAVAMGRQEGTIRGLQFRAIASLRRALGIELETTDIVSLGSPALTPVPVPVRS
jgi:DNA-directed RNA polymerase specialized sigma24 family protein